MAVRLGHVLGILGMLLLIDKSSCVVFCAISDCRATQKPVVRSNPKASRYCLGLNLYCLVHRWRVMPCMDVFDYRVVLLFVKNIVADK